MVIQNILFDLFIIAVFAGGVYAFLIAPRQRQFRQQQKLVRTLEPGTQVLTYGGMLGTVKEIDREQGVVTLAVAEGVELRFVAAAITGEFDREAYAREAQKALK